MKARDVTTILALVVLTAGGLRATSLKMKAKSLERAMQARIEAVYRQLPLCFEANQGQTDRDARFLSRGPGYTLLLTATEAILNLDASPEGEKPRVLRLKYMGANPNPELVGLKLLR